MRVCVSYLQHQDGGTCHSLHARMNLLFSQQSSLRAGLAVSTAIMPFLGILTLAMTARCTCHANPLQIDGHPASYLMSIAWEAFPIAPWHMPCGYRSVNAPLFSWALAHSAVQGRTRVRAVRMHPYKYACTRMRTCLDRQEILKAIQLVRTERVII